MNNNPRFHLFSFHPKKLLEERIQIETKFSDVEESMVKIRSRINLPKLLDKIKKVSLKELSALIATLRRMDILLLIYEYPYKNESHETKTKINEILTSKYSSLVGKTAWQLFQQDIHDPYLHQLIKNSFNKEKETFLHIQHPFLVPIGKAMVKKEGIIEGLVDYLIRANVKLKEVLKNWKVVEGSILEEQLVKKMLIKSRFSDFILKRDGAQSIAKILNHYSMNDYKKILKIYLESRKHDQFNQTIMKQAIHRLFDPRERMADWTLLSEEALMEVKKWLLKSELKKFFENDSNSTRFDYWKRYIDYMEDVLPLKVPLVAFIYFKNFVVVEFGKIGAAYFYHREGFEKIILPRINSYQFKNTRSEATKERLLKETDEIFNSFPLYITKLSHSGNWSLRFDFEVRNHLIDFNE